MACAIISKSDIHPLAPGAGASRAYGSGVTADGAFDGSDRASGHQ
jgi:hypothetical protein